jgi:hypothetical protein
MMLCSRFVARHRNTNWADDVVMMAGALPNGNRDNNDLARLENVCLDSKKYSVYPNIIETKYVLRLQVTRSCIALVLLACQLFANCFRRFHSLLCHL